MSEHLCPCGCGRELELYAGGRRPLVCYSTWRRVPAQIRSQWEAATESRERRVAAFEILRVARSVKAERQNLELPL